MQEYITEKDGRKRKAEAHVCKECQKPYLRRIVVAKGRVKSEFCSNECKYEYAQKQIDAICHKCGRKFTRTQSKLDSARHGYHFCSRECKDFSQSLDGDCKDIRPDHYRDGASSYIDRAFRNLPNYCCSCNIDKQYLLTVHHIDGNRLNGQISNLEIVCFNCHAKRHLKSNGKGWDFNTRELTDRMLLDIV